MTKYIKLNRIKLMKGIFDALVLEEEPKYGDIYVEMINVCDEPITSVDKFIRKCACLIGEPCDFNICLKMAVYYKLIKEKGKI